MYNRTDIFQAAWAAYRSLSRNLRGEITGTFADCLAMAWGNAKRRSTMSPEDKLFLLNMQDVWEPADYAEAERLKQEIAEKKRAAEAA